jgi:hypothetical protein
MLRSFAEDRCRSRGLSCKRCVVDTVESNCPYNPDQGPPDCAKLRACAQGCPFFVNLRFVREKIGHFLQVF